MANSVLGSGRIRKLSSSSAYKITVSYNLTGQVWDWNTFHSLHPKEVYDGYLLPAYSYFDYRKKDGSLGDLVVSLGAFGCTRLMESIRGLWELYGSSAQYTKSVFWLLYDSGKGEGIHCDLITDAFQLEDWKWGFYLMKVMTFATDEVFFAGRGYYQFLGSYDQLVDFSLYLYVTLPEGGYARLVAEDLAGEVFRVLEDSSGRFKDMAYRNEIEAIAGENLPW